MTDLRPCGGREAGLDGAGGRPRGRLLVGVGVVLVAGAVAVAALAGCAALESRLDPTEAAASPSIQPSPAVPTEAAATASSSATATTSAAAGSTASLATPAALAQARIALVDGSGALVTVDAVGGSRVVYPSNGVAIGFPAWSPDGSRIAVVAQGADDTAIFVYAVDRAAAAGAEPTVVYRSAERLPFYLYWRPNGRHVSFLTSEAVGLALRVAPVDGGTTLDDKDETAVLRRGAPLYFHWGDADRVLLHVGGGPEAFTGQVGLDGKGVGEPVAGSGSFRAASLSRDGRFITYARSTADGTAEIVVETTDASSSHRIPAFGPAAMLFGPTGDTLATIAADKPTSDTLGFPLGPLRLIDASTGTSRTLLEGSLLACFWAPDGRTIAALRLAGTAPAPITVVGRPVLARVGPPGPLPAIDAPSTGVTVGLVFVDVASGNVRSEGVVRVADAFLGQLLPYFDQYALSHHLWSPDSTSLLLPLVDPSGKDQLVVIPADGSDPRPIADGSKGFWNP